MVRLGQNYPNPFNPSTEILYELFSPGHVRLEVFDMTGRSVGVLSDGVRPAGQHTERFDASGLPTGMYVYRLTTGVETLTRIMTLVR
ncbi:MAG: T9SS type A sorting domain-containing protein [Bacteroidetes bacterium SB0662_bin_6]|nr:T9SS type A sorting domain-containing protein [Bacteroidetes bacterium SB0668_bin_1]MYE03493.1 T9SS type A sorting domain-containing protein [Bacteroidetes bacterium SB0662_bin_6]